MRYPQLPEPEDDSDRERRARVIAGRRRRLVDALNQVSIRFQPARKFVVELRGRDLATLSENEAHHLAYLVWEYRRELPAELRPKLPPHDPIVQAMELVDV